MDEATRQEARQKARARYERNPDSQRKRAYLRAMRRIKNPRAATLEKWDVHSFADNETFDPLL